MKKNNVIHWIYCFGLFCFASSPLYSEGYLDSFRQVINTSFGQPKEGNSLPNLVTEAIVLATLALLPFFVMLFSSFIKMIIVMGLLKNAVGTAQIPPNQVTNGIALILTVYIMTPTALAMHKEANRVVDAKQIQIQLQSNQVKLEEVLAASEEPEKLQALLNIDLQDPVNYLEQMVVYGKEPLRGFLSRNTLTKHLRHFHQIAVKNFPEEMHEELDLKHFLVLLPSYITSQLQLSFEIGVLIYLPFFIIDLVTSNVLLAMGMMMLSPMTISLPLKLLLLVSVDGWTLLIRGLTNTFH